MRRDCKIYFPENSVISDIGGGGGGGGSEKWHLMTLGWGGKILDFYDDVISERPLTLSVITWIFIEQRYWQTLTSYLKLYMNIV